MRHGIICPVLQKCVVWLLLLSFGAPFFSETALAADGNDYGTPTSVWTAKLTATHITLGFNKYVTFTYCGNELDSRYAGSVIAYSAWQVMNDLDKQKTVAWYGGSVEAGERQFGKDNFTRMRKWYNDRTGWTEAREIFSGRLMDREYPELYEFYEEIDEETYEKEWPAEYLRGGYPLANPGISTADIDSFDAHANQYGVIYEAGFAEYRRLSNLTTAQTGTAFTALSGELVKLIIENTPAGKPGGTMFDLALAVKGFVDTSLDYVNEKVNQKLDGYMGVRRQTGTNASGFAGVHDAAQLIKLYWRLRREAAANAEACMRACKALLQQLDGEEKALQEKNAGLEANRKENERRIQTNYTASVAEGVAQVNSMSVPPVLTSGSTDYYVDPEQLNAGTRYYYKKDDSGNEVFDQALYDADCVKSANKWAADMLKSVKDNADGWVRHYTVDVKQSSKGVEQAERWNQLGTFQLGVSDEELRLSIAPLDLSLSEDGNIFHSGEPDALLSYPNYSENIESRIALLDERVALLNTLLTEAKDYRDFWARAETDFASDMQPYRNQAWTLTVGNHPLQPYDDADGDQWGLTAVQYGEFCQNYWIYPMSIIAGERVKGERYVIALTAHYNASVEQREAYQAAVEETAAALPEIFRMMQESQERMEEGMLYVREGFENLERLKNSYPDWLKTWLAAHRETNIYGVLYDGGIQQDSIYSMMEASGVDMNAEEDETLRQIRDYAKTVLYPTVKDYPEEESSYIMQRDAGITLFDEGFSLRQRVADSGGCDDDVFCANLNALVGARPALKSSQTLRDEFNEGWTGSGNRWARYTAQDVRVSPNLRELVNDLGGNSAYLVEMQGLHARMLNELGDLWRAAKNGNAAPAIGYIDSGVASYTQENPGIYARARYNSYTAYDLKEYFGENMKVAYDIMNYAYGSEIAYNPVVRLEKRSAGRRRASADLTVPAGTELPLEVDVIGENESTEATFPGLLWTVDNSDVAEIDENGTLRAIRPGNVNVTATAVDSPSNAPIRVSFSVEIPEGEKSGHFYLAGSTAELSGGSLRYTAALGFEGTAAELSASGAGGTLRAVCAFYDSGRFLGCSMQAVELDWYGGLPMIAASVPCAGDIPAALQVRLFLLDSVELVPIGGYVPLELQKNDILIN